MLNSGYFFNETRSRANELLEVAKIMGKIKMASQVNLSEKSFAMQLSVFWLFFPQKKADRTNVLSALYLIKRLNASLYWDLAYFKVGWYAAH